jgi:predicted Zn-dependent peptidase
MKSNFISLLKSFTRASLFIGMLISGTLMANSLPKHYTKTLDNGLQVVVIPMDNGSGVITTDIYYKVGSRNETMGKSGMAHMLEHLSFKSTDKLKEGEFDMIVKSRGGINNAATGFDKTHYFIKTSSQNLPMTFELFAELMNNLKLTNEEFQTERDVVAEERRLRTDNNPMGYLYFRIFNTHYTYHPYHWLPIGFMEDILGWKIEDIRTFYQQHYQPNNAILIVAGDIKPETVFEEAQKEFGVIKNRTEVPEVTAVEPKVDGAKRAILHKEGNQVDTLAITYAIPNYENDDQVVLSAISAILSHGKSSRFEKSLVNEKKLVNTIYGYNMELKDPGVFLIMAMCATGVTPEEAEKEILAELEKIKKGDVTQEELNKVKINTKAEFIYSLESSHTVAGLYGEYLVKGNLDPLLEYEEKLDKITLKDIQDVAKKYFDHSKSTTVILKKDEIKN